jgi:hypothetical protein
LLGSPDDDQSVLPPTHLFRQFITPTTAQSSIFRVVVFPGLLQ